MVRDLDSRWTRRDDLCRAFDSVPMNSYDLSFSVLSVHAIAEEMTCIQTVLCFDAAFESLIHSSLLVMCDLLIFLFSASLSGKVREGD